MTCLEAQSNIMAFIDKKLPDDRAVEFVRHIKNCPNCSEELEIYYTLIVGTRQLDNNEELSKDFSKDLNNELMKLSNKVKKAKRFKLSTFGICCAALIIGFAVFYSSILNKVYNIEQNYIKAMQGDMYFYDCYGEYIELSDKDFKDEYEYKQMLKTYNNRSEEYRFYIDVRQYVLSNGMEDNQDE